ncbi:MAG: hypothetical protein A2Y17_04790 [Clostridiales bacterium GWF2_38_85]|nr:MAG: hypothetical protein A2Y17_04790 [Clostridiales bacterium GWF2_38_85]HBL84396.1 hypothetical protein [Clostridiales bacterium]
MTFYHGSSIAGIAEIGAKSEINEREKAPVVYLTPNRAYALFYIRDLEVNFVTCGVTAAGYIRYDERFPDQLRMLYKGKSGYLYKCGESTDFKTTSTRGVWVTKNPVLVEGVEYIPDVYEEILKYEATGEVRVIRFETLTDGQKQDIFDMLVNYIYKNDMINQFTRKAEFYRNNFPDAWDYVVRHPDEKQTRIDEWNKRHRR